MARRKVAAILYNPGDSIPDNLRRVALVGYDQGAEPDNILVWDVQEFTPGDVIPDNLLRVAAIPYNPGDAIPSGLQRVAGGRSWAPSIPLFVAGISTGSMYAEDAAAIQSDLGIIQSAGANAVRLDFHWSATEATQGTYDWTVIDTMFDAADTDGILPIAILQTVPGWANGNAGWARLPTDPANFAAFCVAVVGRYKHRGKHGLHVYEIWNEPNLATFNDSPTNFAGYVALLQAAYSALKSADPQCVVVLGGPIRGGTPMGANTGLVQDDYWLSQIYAFGGGPYFDAVGYHPYAFGIDPSATTPTGADTGSNLVSNPSIETNTTGWVANHCVISRVTTEHHDGVASLRAVADGAGVLGVTGPWGNVTSGQLVHFSVWVKAVTGLNMWLQLDWFDAAYGYVSSSTQDYGTCLAGHWVQLGYWVTVPTGVAFCSISLATESAASNGTTIYVDDAGMYVSSVTSDGWNRIAAMRAVMVANGDMAKQMWLTEWGQYTGTATGSVSEANQAVYIAHAFVRAKALDYVRALFIHHHRDSGTTLSDLEQNYGITKNDGTHKDAFAAFQTAAGN